MISLPWYTFTREGIGQEIKNYGQGRGIGKWLFPPGTPLLGRLFAKELKITPKEGG